MKLDRRLLEALEATGLPYEVENGKKHTHIRVQGRLVGILPHGNARKSENSGRGMQNTIAQIRRAARTLAVNRVIK